MRTTRKFRLILAGRAQQPSHRHARLLSIGAITAITVIALIPGGHAFAAQRQAMAAQPSCGDTITADTTLVSDLTNCPGDGIVIGADNITLDLNGYTIGGDAMPAVTGFDIGIRNEGHDGVTIEGGTVRQFDRGVEFDRASGNRLLDLTVTNNNGRAIVGDGSTDTLIEGNFASSNDRSGLILLSSDHNMIDHNRFSGNAAAGIGGFTASQNRIEHNVLSDNGNEGTFWTDGSNDNQIYQNSVSDNNGEGMVIDGGSSRNAVIRNHVFRNHDDIIIAGSNNTVIANLVTDALACDDGCGYGISVNGGSDNLVARNVVARTVHGIRLDAYEQPPVIRNVFRDNVVNAAGVNGIAINADQVGPMSDTVLDGNVAIGASNDGIYVGSASTTLTRNLGMHNGNLGIEAVPGVTDGGGNHAAGNGNPAQCTNVAC
jgi:parallel beta-helix repeat protein